MQKESSTLSPSSESQTLYLIALEGDYEDSLNFWDVASSEDVAVRYAQAVIRLYYPEVSLTPTREDRWSDDGKQSVLVFDVDEDRRIVVQPIQVVTHA